MTPATAIEVLDLMREMIEQTEPYYSPARDDMDRETFMREAWVGLVCHVAHTAGLRLGDVEHLRPSTFLVEAAGRMRATAVEGGIYDHDREPGRNEP